MGPYQYEPLSSPASQIRLLELLPGRGIIQCRLKVTGLEEARYTYDPISYCWKAYARESWLGSNCKEKRQKRIRVRIDGADFYINESLHGALRQMRYESGSRVLWADAICINQEDDKEKSAQVAIMAHIYKGGSRTLAWLGEADHRTGKAFKYLKDCARREFRTSSSSSINGRSPPESIPGTSEMSRAPAIYKWLPALWHSICRRRSVVSVESIIHRPYFRRTWVVQEIAKSNSVLFMCGKFVISWDDLRNGYSELTFSVYGEDSFTALDDIWSSLYDYDLMEVVMMASPTQASDPRDKLYGLLGLVPDNAMTVDVTVDYNKDSGDVFYDFTRGLLLSRPKLEVLSMSYGCSPEKPRHVPSWVWDPQPGRPYYRFSRPHFISEQYQAAGDSESRPEFRGRMLGLRGFVFQTIATVCSSWNKMPRPNLPFHMDDPRQFLEKILWYFENRAIGGMGEVSADSTTAEHRRDILFRTTWPYKFSSLTPLSDRAEAEEARSIMKLTSFDSEMVKRFGNYVSGGNKDMTLWTKLKLLVAIEKLFILETFGDPAAREFSNKIPSFASLNKRQLARTDEGCIVLCPEETEVHDKLVLLQGSNVPFILRRIGGHWKIVGECYVHDLMDGSAWDESKCEMLWIE